MTRAFQATDRTVLRIAGEDHHKFLQDLVTNSLDGLKDGLVYAALLTPQGKYLADFFLVARDEGLLLDADAPGPVGHAHAGQQVCGLRADLEAQLPDSFVV